MTRLRFTLLAAVLAAGCGGNSLTDPSSNGTFAGTYNLVVTTASTCAFSATYTVPVVVSSAKSDAGLIEVRATLPGGNSQVDFSFFYTGGSSTDIGAGDLTIESYQTAANSYLTVSAIASGKIASSGSRLKASGSASGDLGTTNGTDQPRACTGFHPWSLNPS
jgi:hypothetical protein